MTPHFTYGKSSLPATARPARGDGIRCNQTRAVSRRLNEFLEQGYFSVASRGMIRFETTKSTSIYFSQKILQTIVYKRRTLTVGDHQRRTTGTCSPSFLPLLLCIFRSWLHGYRRKIHAQDEWKAKENRCGLQHSKAVGKRCVATAVCWFGPM